MTTQLDDDRRSAGFLASAWALVGAIAGAAIAYEVLRRKQGLTAQSGAPATGSQQHGRAATIHIASQSDETDPSLANRRNLEESAQQRVPEAYLGVATVIQGITIGVLGEAIVRHGFGAPGWVTWILIVSSFLVSLNFWLAFVMGYLYLFRVVRLGAASHLGVTVIYFGMGLCQIVAYSSVDRPARWLVCAIILVLLSATYSAFLHWLLKQHAKVHGALGDLIGRAHRSIALMHGLAVIPLGVLIWLLPKYPLVVIIVPILATLILADEILDFRRRQQSARDVAPISTM